MTVERQALLRQSAYSFEQRKLLGVHYTPDEVVEYIVRLTLQPYLDRGDLDAVRGLTIIDPACGSGLFLLKAFDVLCAFWRDRLGQLHTDDVRHILENNLYGVDIDPSAVDAAKGHLALKAEESGVRAVDLDQMIQCGDALLRPAPHVQLAMPFASADSANSFDWKGRFASVFARGGFDCVVGNPPYVRIQHVQPPERRVTYAATYETARGRFDLAGLFIELANNLTRTGGRVGYIVSNKLLTTRGASELRDYILTRYTVVEIIDLTDTKLFEAAVLPMILILENRRPEAQSFTYASIQEIEAPRLGVVSVDRLLSPLDHSQLPLRIDVEWKQRCYRVEKFDAPLPKRRQPVWTFHYPLEHHLLEKLRKDAACTLDDLTRKISVGLKTTADDVFIKPLTAKFIEQSRLERGLLHPVLESHNIDRWKCIWSSDRDLHVLYPHEERGGKVVPVDLGPYPHARRYLQANRQQLEARAYLRDSGRQWYEIWVHQSPSDFAQLKLVTPDIASHNCFALDDQSFFVNGTCFYIILRDQSYDYNLLLLSLLNSKVLEFFHKLTSGNSLYAKRFRYWTSYLKTYPIPAIGHPRNAAVVRQIIENARRLTTIATDRERSSLEEENDRLIYSLFGLTSQEIQDLESSIVFQRTSSKSS